MPYTVVERLSMGPRVLPQAQNCFSPEGVRERAVQSKSESVRRHTRFYLVTVTTQQDFDVFIDVVTCINQDLIRF